jgi:hypothetical protein
MQPGEEMPPSTPNRRSRRVIGLTLVLGLLAALTGGPACRRSTPPPPTIPTPLPTALPIAIVPTPTVSFPPKMGLAGTIDPTVAKALTASVPAIPTHVGESRPERAETSAPATPPPNAPIR